MRFLAFTRAALSACQRLRGARVMHCNDWHTAFAPLFLRATRGTAVCRDRTLLTIHNIGYQGIFPAAQRADPDLGSTLHAAPG